MGLNVKEIKKILEGKEVVNSGRVLKRGVLLV